MSLISLKIHLIELNTTKTLQFPGSTLIIEVVKDVRAKAGEQAGGSDHSLFWPDHGLWLEAGRSLDFYDLKSGDLLELKKKHRILRVKILDGSIKTVWIDESATVSTVVELVCEKLGIANPAEYSFQPDENSAFGSNTNLSKTKAGKTTNTDNNWLNPDKTLPEQKISESEMVVLKKKFFFSDINIDRNDPVQLNLLYVQSKEAIVSGKYPVSPEEASQFAAIQLQVQSGSHDPDKHKPGFLNLNDSVPVEYHKSKTVEKMIYSEHRKLQGLTELNAKYRYIQLCRSLKTYGVSFFVVKEMNPKKNKLIKVMLGVTKDSVVRLDAETKDVIKSWPLTQLRRWAASPNSFTLDFGDYADSYYSVQTSEGEQISQLISGYIDIIMKKTKEAEKICVDDVQQEAAVEDYVRPSKFSRMKRNGDRVAGQQAQTGYYGGANVATVAGSGRMGVAKAGSAGTAVLNYEMGSASQVAVDKVHHALSSLAHAVGDLSNVYELPPANFNDPALTAWRLKTDAVSTDAIASLVHAQLASTAHVASQLSLGAQGEMDILAANIAALSSNMAQLSNHAKLLAALESDSSKQEEFLNTCRLFGMATHNFLESVQSVLLGQADAKASRDASASVSATASNLLTEIERINVTATEREALINAAFVVGEAVKVTVAKTKLVASHFQDNQTRLSVAEDAKQAIGISESLTESAQIVAPAYKAIVCQDVIMQTAIGLKDGIATINDSAKSCPSASALEDLRLSSRKVYDAITRLIFLLKSNSGLENQDRESGNAAASLANSATAAKANLQYLIETPAQKMDLISKYASEFQAHSGEFCNTLNALGRDAGSDLDPVEKERLKTCTMAVSQAASLLSQQVKAFLAEPSPDEQSREAFVKTSGNLSALIDSALGFSGASGRVPNLNKLATYAQACAESSTMLFAAGKAVSTCNRNAKSQQQLIQSARIAESSVGKLVYASRQYQVDPSNPRTQYELVQTARAVTLPLAHVVSLAKGAAPTVADSAAQSHLLHAANTQADDLKVLAAALDELHGISAAVTVDGVLRILRDHKEDLNNARVKYRQLRPNPKFSTIDEGCESVEVGTQSMSQVTGKLATGVAQNNTRIVLPALQDIPDISYALCDACKSVSALSEDDSLRTKVLDKGIFAMSAAEQLLHALKVHGISENSAQNSAVFAQAKQLSAALNNLVSILPGHAALGDVGDRIGRLLTSLQATPVSTGEHVPLANARNKFISASTALSMAITDMVSAAQNSQVEYQSLLKGLENEYESFANSVQPVVNAMPTDSERQRFVHAIAELAPPTSALLDLKFEASDGANGGEYFNKNEFKSAALNLKGAIASLISASVAPGPAANSEVARQCDVALNGISLASMLLDENQSKSAPRYNFAECLQLCQDQSKQLVSNMAAMQTSTRVNDTETLRPAIIEGGQSLEKLTEAATTAALILALADQSTIPAKPAVVDISKLSLLLGTLTQVAFSVAKGLVSPANAQATAPLLDAMTDKVPQFVNELKSLAGNASLDSELRSKLLNLYKNTTAALLPNFLTSLKEQSAEAPKNAEQLLSSLDTLQRLIDSNVALSGTPAYFGASAHAVQKPILDLNRQLLVHGNNLIGSVKTAILTNGDKDTLNFVSQHSRSVAESLKALTNLVASAAPGQKECTLALTQLEQYADDVENAIVASNEGTLEVPEKDREWYAEGLNESMTVLKPQLDALAAAAKTDAVKLAKTVVEVPTHVNSVLSYATGLAADFSQPNERELRQDILLRAKALAETTRNLIRACRVAGGNAKSAYLHQIDTTHSEAKASWNELQRIAQDVTDGANDGGLLGQYANEIGQILAKSNKEDISAESGGKAEDYNSLGTQLQKQVRAYATLVQSVSQAAKNPDSLDPLGKDLFDQFNTIFTCSNEALKAAQNPAVKKSLFASASKLGGAVLGLLGVMKAVKSQPDASNRVKLAAQIKDTSSSIAELLDAAKQGMKAVMDIEDASESLTNAVLDLDSALIFAKAGQLDSINGEKEQFSNFSEAILKDAKNLSDSERFIIGGATANASSVSVEKLAEVCKSTAGIMNTLKDNVRSGVAAITSSDKHMQLELLNTAKSVASALLSLINNAFKIRTGAVDAQDNTSFTENVKENVVAVSSLVRLVNLLTDEGSRGIRALESTGSEIREMIQNLQGDPPAIGSALPEEIAVLAKQVGQACLNLTNNSNNKEGLISSTTTLRKLFEDIYRVTVAAIEGAPQQARTDVKSAVSKLAESAVALIGLAKDTNPNKLDIQNANKQVGGSVTVVCDAVSRLTPAGYFDKNDPNVVAERELMLTAQAMDQMVSKIRAAEANIKHTDNLAIDIDGQIFEGAKAIAAATSVLLRTATSLQREIVASERHNGSKRPAEKYIQNGQWSDGLVSAAKQVAATVGELCELANSTLKASADGVDKADLLNRREHLIVTGRSINAASSQLIMAACTKTDDSQSPSLARLKAAGKTVVTSVDQIVHVVEDNLEFERDNNFNVMKPLGATNSIAVEMQAQMEILKVERELEKARRRLADVRKNKYKNANGNATAAAGRERSDSQAKTEPRGVARNPAELKESQQLQSETQLARSDSQSSTAESRKNAPTRKAPPPPPPARASNDKKPASEDDSRASAGIFRDQPIGKRVSKLAEQFGALEVHSNEEINQNNLSNGQAGANAKATMKTLNPFNRASKTPALPTAASIFQSNPLYDSTTKNPSDAPEVPVAPPPQDST